MTSSTRLSSDSHPAVTALSNVFICAKDEAIPNVVEVRDYRAIMMPAMR